MPLPPKPETTEGNIDPLCLCQKLIPKH